jgi:hypothetical protein
MRIRTSLLLFFGLASPAFACGAGAAKMVTTNPQQLQVFAEVDPITVSKPFGLQLILCDGGDPAVTVAHTLEADAWMPRHKHGMNYTPTVEQQGKHRFAVTNMVFHMPGLWQVKVNLRAEGKTKSSTYLLDVEVK